MAFILRIRALLSDVQYPSYKTCCTSLRPSSKQVGWQFVIRISVCCGGSIVKRWKSEILSMLARWQDQFFPQFLSSYRCVWDKFSFWTTVSTESFGSESVSWKEPFERGKWEVLWKRHIQVPKYNNLFRGWVDKFFLKGCAITIFEHNSIIPEFFFTNIIFCRLTVRNDSHTMLLWLKAHSFVELTRINCIILAFVLVLHSCKAFIVLLKNKMVNFLASFFTWIQISQKFVEEFLRQSRYVKTLSYLL